MGRRYWVRREECWGGTYVYFVATEIGYKTRNVSKPFQNERDAKKLCERMTSDREKYDRAMAGDPAILTRT